MSAVITNGATMETADETPVKPAKSTPSTMKLALVGLLIALVAGGIGALFSSAAFPSHNGKVGATGPAGPKGPAGPAGSAASVAQVNVDTNKLGYCFNTNAGDDSNGDYVVSGVSLYPPTVSSGGALSCPTGNFVSLTPDTPQGNSASNYNAMVQPSANTSNGSSSSGTTSTSTSSTSS